MATIFLDDPLQRDFLVYREGSGKSVEIFDIQVGTERGIGLGRQLINELLRRIRDTSEWKYKNISLVYAITRESSHIAKQFYYKVGFRVVGYLHDFYQDTHENGVMFGINLQERNR